MIKVFIGGSRSIRKLDVNIEEKLANIMQKRYLVLIGDVSGVDSLVQRYFQISNYPNVIVYKKTQEGLYPLGYWDKLSQPFIPIGPTLVQKDKNFYPSE